MKKTTIGSITALFFALITAGSFYWLWTTTTNEVSKVGATGTNYSIVEIESVKQEAVSILSGLENKSSIPIGVPTEKMGRENPYINY